jgi:hypothetical protein
MEKKLKEGKPILSHHFVSMIYPKFSNKEIRLINKCLNIAQHLLENDSCFWKIENVMQALRFNKEIFYMNKILVDKSVFVRKLLTAFS